MFVFLARYRERLVGSDEGREGLTRGERVYLIRKALGTLREPMPLERFADIIRKTSGVDYDTSILSRMETGKRKVSIEDIEAIAPVDPLKRGRSWLAGWDSTPAEKNARGHPPLQFADPARSVPLPKPAAKKNQKKGNG